MRLHNRQCGVAASVFAAATMAMATFGQPASSQPLRADVEASPHPAAAMAGYRAVDAWVRAWKVPDSPPADLGSLRGGAHVQLRLDGVLVGRGQSLPAVGAPGGSAILEATREAMQAAEPRLGVPNDAMRDAALQEQAARVMISLDLAGPLTSIEPATWAEAELMLSPGLEGVAAAMRAEQGDSGGMLSAFPSQLIATGTLPHRGLAGLCAGLIGEGGAAAALDEPRQIRAKHGVRMYKFRTTHLAQCRPGVEPAFLYRGARLIDQSEITAAELRAMADGMVRQMATVKPGHLGRAFTPSTGLYSEATPLKESIALRLVALRAYLDAAKAGGPGGAADEARRAWDATVAWLSSSAPLDGDDDTAMFLLAIACPPGGDPERPGIMGSSEMPYAGDPVGWLANRGWSEGQMLGRLAPQAQAVGALAYAMHPVSRRLIDKGRSEPRDLAAHEAEIRLWLGTVNAGQLVAQMPWAGWAEIQLAERNREQNGVRVDIPSAVALRDMRRQVWEHQIGLTDVDRDSMDLAGGIVFTKGTTPLPTWQCARPLAFIASMLRDPRLTEPQERPAELARLLHAFRFIRQLQADESIGWMASRPELAAGGLRAATWDQSMPPDATSMALLAVVEALKSLDALTVKGNAIVVPEREREAPATRP